MRLYLDTNILIFLLIDPQSICSDVREHLGDYANTLHTSSACLQELICLIQAGKLHSKGLRDMREAAAAALQRLDEMGVEVVPVTRKHFDTLATLPLRDDHRDPNDRIIIAQAISDRATLVSSDRKFSHYEPCGLDFLFNDR